MSDATAAMNGATSDERARNQQQRPPQQRQRLRRNRRPNLARSSLPGEGFRYRRHEPKLAEAPEPGVSARMTPCRGRSS